MPRTLSTLVICLFVAFLCVQSFQGAEGARRKPKIKFCKWDMFINCMFEPLAYFTSQPNGSGIVNSEEEMEQYCL